MVWKTLRLLTVALIAVFGTCLAILNPATADDPLQGINYDRLVVICDQYQGELSDPRDVPEPYRYGCRFSDGEAYCLETTECSFFPVANAQAPFEQSCELGKGRFEEVTGTIFTCTDEMAPDRITITCPDGRERERCPIYSEQPIPAPPVKY